MMECKIGDVKLCGHKLENTMQIRNKPKPEGKIRQNKKKQKKKKGKSATSYILQHRS